MTRIVVIDDDQTLLDLMAEVLAERDWTMHTVLGVPRREECCALREHWHQVSDVSGHAFCIC